MDSFFLYVETPAQHMHVTLTAVLDPAAVPGGYSFDRFKAHIAGRVPLVPPFTRKLVPVPLRLHHPLWATDPDFDIDNHVLRAAVPAPGGLEELSEVVGQIASLPLDRSRPLWEIWLVEGLADGEVAFVAKIHHAALDGVGGVEQMVAFFDLEADPAPAEPVPFPEPEAIPSDLELVAFAAGSRLRGLADVVPLVRRTGGLADTVTAENGFLFDDPTPAALAAAFEELATAFRAPERWRAIQLAGMGRDSSWDASARAYSELFAELAG